MTIDRAAIAIVGAGPRGTGLLERIAASVPELLPQVGGGAALDVHLIDPYPAGAGRIWRHAQSPLLAMNSMAADVTMFTDESVRCDGPIVTGPSMWDWAQDLREGRLARECADDLGPELAAELDALTAATFPSRRLQSAYLGWVLRHVQAGCRTGSVCTSTSAAPRVSRTTAAPSSSTSTAVPRCGWMPSSSRPATSTPPRPMPSSTSPHRQRRPGCATSRRSRPPTATCRSSSPASR